MSDGEKQVSTSITGSFLIWLMSFFVWLKKIYLHKLDTRKNLYCINEIYKNSQGKQIVVCKILDTPRGVFTMEAAELVLRRKDLLSGFAIEDIVSIIGLAVSEKEPLLIETRMVPYRLYTLIAMLFGVSLLVSNILSSKLISVFGITMTGGALAFPMTYAFGDILTEVYGYKRARQLIWGTIACNLFAMLFIQLTIAMPPSPFWHKQQAFAEVLGSIPRVDIASLVSYCLGEFINSYVIAKLKLVYRGQLLWMRIVASTVAATMINGPVFALLAYYGKLPNEELLFLIGKIYIFNVAYEIFALPITYWLINFLKKKEAVDIYDDDTNFTPFSLETDYSMRNNHFKNA